MRKQRSIALINSENIDLEDFLVSDVSDKANDLAEMERNQAILDALRATVPVYTGMCRNCSEPLEEGAFCDASCSEDYHKRERMRG